MKNKGIHDKFPFEKEEILGTGITTASPQDVYQFCKTVFDQGAPAPVKIYTPNPEIVMKAEKDEQYRSVLNRGVLVVPDGIGVVLASRFRFGKIKKRITGIDLLEHLLSVAAESGKSVYLLGSRPGVAETAGVKMLEKYPGLIVSGTHHGYYNDEEEERLVDQIEAAKPDLLVVALGAPKQEIFIDRYADRIGINAAIGVGGALDVWSGNVERAPKFLSRIGLEWLYRVIKQPSRIPRLAIIPKFVFKSLFTRK
ncbi:MAG: WecB/TagA/CpsF family glycosyltransferase [Bacillota bacterium]|nr:WecB/TagA/CpsF family glycosyltransferase [Bacillota bacterium]